MYMQKCGIAIKIGSQLENWDHSEGSAISHFQNLLRSFKKIVLHVQVVTSNQYTLYAKKALNENNKIS